jgi:uncharacterized protein YecT (DUF1311 family)
MVRRGVLATAVSLLVLGLAVEARAQLPAPEEPDPCADTIGRSEASACWSREAERTELELREAYDALLKKLPARAGDALRKSQKAWLDARDAQLALLYTIANPDNRHSWQHTLCSTIARRELTRARVLVLRRLADPAHDEECPL